MRPAKRQARPRLSAVLRERILSLLRDGCPEAVLLAKLAELPPSSPDGPPPDGPSPDRPFLDGPPGLADLGGKLHRSRSLAQALVKRLEDAPESRQARLNIELMHTLIMDLLIGETGDMRDVLDPAQVMTLSSAMQKLAGAAKTETELQFRVRRELQKEAALAVDRVALREGLNTDQVEALKAEFLGLAG
jgi:hypothetical protein